MINQSAINAAAINANAGPSNAYNGNVSLVFQQNVDGDTGAAAVDFDQIVADTGDTALVFLQDVSYPVESVSLEFVQRVAQTGDSSLNLSQNVYDPVIVADSWTGWDASVIIGGVDSSDDITGTMTIEAERSAARLAEFTLLLSGPVATPHYVGKTVEINYIEKNGASWRRFTGIIDTAIYNVSTKSLNCRCVDKLQKVVEGYDNDELQTLTEGYWSDEVFDADKNGWDHLNDLLTTVDKAVYLDSNRQLKIAEQQNKLIADYDFDHNLILDESLSVDIANINQIVNRIDISYQTRYSRLFHRNERIVWRYPRRLCEEFFFPVTMPNQSMVEIAIADAGWHFSSAGYTPLWKTGVYQCMGKTVVFNNRYPEGIRGFTANAAFRWQQTVNETYTIRVIEPNSIEYYGSEFTEEIGAATEFKTELTDWGTENDDFTVSPDNMVPDGTGSKRVDDTDDATIEDALNTLIAQAMTTITRSHQQNNVIFELPLSPYLELGHTINITDTEVSAKGIVNKITENYDFDNGAPITKIELTISVSGSGLDRNPMPINAPLKPALSVGEDHISASNIPTHIGGASDSQPANDDFTGMILNQVAPAVGSELYDAGLKIEFSAIDDDNTLNKDSEVEHQINFAVPDNTLTLTA